MNRWDQPEIPHRGWLLAHVDDRGRAEHTCEMCGKESIRYVHTLTHPTYESPLTVGCICAEKMSQDYNPREAERGLRNRAQRRKTWLAGAWRRTRNGHARRELDGRLVILIEEADGSWRARLLDTDGAWKGGHRRFAGYLAAAAAVYDFVYPPRVL